MGFTAAFAAALGFVWVDIVKPQQLAYSIINDLPLSLVAALTTLFLFVVLSILFYAIKVGRAAWTKKERTDKESPFQAFPKTN